jgi:hypothetical protein
MTGAQCGFGPGGQEVGECWSSRMSLLLLAEAVKKCLLIA